MSDSLQKSLSIFYYPFRFQANWEEQFKVITGAASIWQKSGIKIREQYLFKHVQDYFNFNAAFSGAQCDQLDLSQGIIFELKDAFRSTRARCSIEKLFTIPLVLSYKEQSFPFQFGDGLKKNIISPKLILVPQSEIGVISFCLSIDKEDERISDLINFNYMGRALNKSIKNSPKIKPLHSNTNTQILEIFQHLQQTGQSSNKEEIGFTFYQFIQFLTGDFNPGEIDPLSPKHFNIFSFAQTANQVAPAELNRSIFCLSRLYNYNYVPPFEKVEDNQEVIQTFKNIYLGVSQEGACIFINSREGDPSFLKVYTENAIKTRYVWIYLLAYLQRITLINTTYKITDVLRKDQNSVTVISQTIQWLSKIQIRSMFSEISHITMHNSFYALCRSNLKIPQLFNELKEEILDLNMIVQQENEQSRLQQSKLEKQQQEKEETRQKATEQKQAKFERRLNLILFGLGLLTFLSVWKDFSDLMQNGLSEEEMLSFGGLLVMVVVLFIIVGFILQKNAKK